MAYQDWFSSWRRGEVQLRGWFRPPEELTCPEISGQDRSAAHLQEEARHLIEDLTAYRIALAERYASLETQPYSMRLELTRHRSYPAGKVTYSLRLLRRYEDGTETAELEEHYKGLQRREALARFETLRRQRPGIETHNDMAPHAWER